MQSKGVKTLALALLLGGVGITVAQQPGAPPGNPGQSGSPPGSPGPRQLKQKTPPKKSKLEEMLAEALKNNADIRVAAAKLAEADAELNRTRIQVTQQVVNLHHAILSQKAGVELEQKRYDRMKELLNQRSIEDRVVDEALTKLTLAKAKLAELEAQMPALLGKRQSSTASELLRSAAWDALGATQTNARFWADGYEVELAVPQGKWEKLEGKLFISPPKSNIPQAEKLRRALQTPVKVDYKEMIFALILKDLSKRVEGLSFRNLFDRLGPGNHSTYSLHFEEDLPVSAILQALADEVGCTFYVREYGILAIDQRSAPPGAMTVEEFLRQKPAGNQAKTVTDPQSSGLPWKTPDHIKGTIKQIGPSGILGISFESVDGLLSGHTLYVYRRSEGDSKAKHLGTVRMVNVRSKTGQFTGYSEAQPIGRFTEPPKLEDEVTAHPPEK